MWRGQNISFCFCFKTGWLKIKTQFVNDGFRSTQQPGQPTREDSVAGVCLRCAQLPTENSLGTAFLPRGRFPDLLIWIMGGDDHNKGPQALLVISSKKCEIPAVQSLSLGPVASPGIRLLGVSEGHKAHYLFWVLLVLLRGKQCWGSKLGLRAQ